MPDGIRTRALRVHDKPRSIGPRAAGKGSRRGAALRSTQLNYGHHPNVLRTLGWPTGVEPAPPVPQTGTLTVEPRPPSSSVLLRSGRRERFAPGRGVAFVHPRRGLAPRRPCVLPRNCLDHPIPLPRCLETKIAPPGGLRGRGDQVRRSMRLVDPRPLKGAPRSSRAACTAPAGPARNRHRNTRRSAGRGRRIRTYPRECRRPATCRCAAPTASPRTTIPGRVGPWRPPVGRVWRARAGAASSCVPCGACMSRRGRSPPHQQKKRAAS